MRIAIIGQKGIPARFGGVERHVEDLATNLAERGHEVYVYTRPNYTPADLASYKGVNLISIKSIGTKHLDAITHTFLACLDVVRRDVDVVHFHSIGPSSLIWLIKVLKPQTPVVATFHTQCYMHQKWGGFAKMYLKFGELVCCKLSDRAIVVSRTLKAYAEKQYRKAVHYIPNGVAVSPVTESDTLAQWELEPREYILVVSRLVKHKGVHYLIEAFKKIETDKKLVIVGDSAFTNSYVRQIHGLAVNDPRIIFTGNQTGAALQQLFSHAYLFVQPSESEGLSIALLEAMAYELAVLVSDIPENLEALSESGFTFKSKSIRDLRQMLSDLLPAGEKVDQSRRKNRQHVLENYNWKDITDNILKVYQEAAESQQSNKRKFKRLRIAGKMMTMFF
ncbi:glycosyltransferase family 4 protein [Candidatus Falkowbacteria bacterium]|nr:glycosyltransferase family 4 protein [Candidatus Falkowbacteria bacterium]